jgi:hypothetical protein
MGLACPVCSLPQADGEHLANHLAFAAILHGGDHEAWLDSHVADWSARDPAGLASAVIPLAEETGHDAPGGDSTDVDDDSRVPPFRAAGLTTGPDRLDPETRRVVERARELTRRMRASEAAEE